MMQSRHATAPEFRQAIKIALIVVGKTRLTGRRLFHKLKRTSWEIASTMVGESTVECRRSRAVRSRGSSSSRRPRCTIDEQNSSFERGETPSRAVPYRRSITDATRFRAESNTLSLVSYACSALPARTTALRYIAPSSALPRHRCA